MARHICAALTLCMISFVHYKATAQRAVVVANNTEFAFNVYREASRSANGGNVFFSPYSISSALAMIYPGARGETAAEMRMAMGFLKVPEAQSKEFSDLNAELSQANSPLVLTNSVWVAKGWVFDANFLRIQTQYFRAGLREVNFLQTDSARKQINKAIEEHTNGKIEDILPPGSITMDTRMVLTNAIYFKDQWRVVFKKELTAQRKFYTTPEKPVDASFMFQSGTFPAFENDNVTILELPYKNENFSMMILLPKGDMADFEQHQLNDENYKSWNCTQTRLTEILIPRFKLDQELNVGPVLEKFGMIKAFRDADFSGVSTMARLRISGVYHKAFVEVSEEGTEAAAATAVGAESRGISYGPTKFVANKPFIFIIRHTKTGSILFIGKVTNPPST